MHGGSNQAMSLYYELGAVNVQGKDFLLDCNFRKTLKLKQNSYALTSAIQNAAGQYLLSNRRS